MFDDLSLGDGPSYKMCKMHDWPAAPVHQVDQITPEHVYATFESIPFPFGHSFCILSRLFQGKSIWIQIVFMQGFLFVFAFLFVIKFFLQQTAQYSSDSFCSSPEKSILCVIDRTPAAWTTFWPKRSGMLVSSFWPRNSMVAFFKWF